MTLDNKRFRYYYWIAREFTKKHLKLISFSFFLSFFIILTLISFTPYLVSIIASKHEVIGISGEYSIVNLPSDIKNKISHGLVSIGEKGEILPALASRWEATDNGRRFKFYLKKNLFWDDGKTFTAKDITYNFKDVDIKALDNYTVEFNLKKPLPIFPVYLATPIFKKPLHGVVGQYRVDKVKLKYGVTREIVLSPNKNDLPTLTYKFYDSEGKLINAYKKGEVTQITIAKKSYADNFVTWKNTKVEKNLDYTKILTLFFNLRNEALQTKEIRQAIAASIPKDELAELGEAANSPISPISWTYNSNLKKTSYNPDVARKTIAKNEATASSKLQFKTYFDYLDTASKINDHLQKSGFKTNLSLNSSAGNEFDLLLTFWEVNTDPDQYHFWHSTQEQANVTGYRNVKIDKLLEDGRSTLDTTKRRAYYLEFQKVIVDDTPAVFIYFPYVYTVKRK